MELRFAGGSLMLRRRHRGTGGTLVAPATATGAAGTSATSTTPATTAFTTATATAATSPSALIAASERFLK